jgi:hypothetical protein
MTIRLLVQDFSEYGQSNASREVGSFTTRAEALAAAQARVDACLEEFFTPGISAEALFQQWSLFGEDVFLLPDEGVPPFSAMAYAKERSRTIVHR